VKGQDPRPQAPLYAYAAVSLSNVVATTCQYEALRYLTFPMQTLAKCAKMLPVMLWGAAINSKTYSLQVLTTHVRIMPDLRHTNNPASKAHMPLDEPIFASGAEACQEDLHAVRLFGLQDYGAALLITIGCACFMVTGSVSAKAAQHTMAVGGLPSHVFGAVLMVTYLTFDGFTSTWQVGFGDVEAHSSLSAACSAIRGAVAFILTTVAPH
jgi:solute carrier family 35 (adenosine 3'-phospho 5'-phosphosulfate transporter), member B2